MTTNQENTPTQQSSANNDEIDLIALVKHLWDGRRIIITYILIGAVLGLLIAILSPKEYTVQTTMVPQSAQSGGSKLGGLSSLAAMAGFNMDMSSGTETLSPMVYPKIMQSVPFRLELMNSSFQIDGLNQPVTLFEYYTEYKKAGVLSNVKKYTIGLPGVIIGALKPTTEDQQPTSNTDKQIITLTAKENQVLEALNSQISLNIDDKEGILTLSTNFPDARLAAQVAHTAQILLQKYITTYRIQKAQEQLDFIKDRYQEKKEEFLETQKRLARFRDQNKNVSSAMAQTEVERLQSEYNIAFSVYSELAKQLEQAQIKVKEDAPVLTIVEPVRVPLQKSKPNRPLILFIWIFLGGIVGIGIVFGRQFLSTVKQRWNE
ncbi:Wzz/FepE/Etk N-terminal domain-containing protein [uncultured Sunxiuqinia sp.]|uniref:Wzz/FepE/Etk N-terminal domain-containing protein n=1 Tax=uncultured Sunxiuqinia sp. TaxID=1573825 RepID=UPI002AA62D45|nr:Wzz/FepE/Etk N-terminal domain-containing protein [uncultured Sunxiuqinia sp.]